MGRITYPAGAGRDTQRDSRVHTRWVYFQGKREMKIAKWFVHLSWVITPILLAAFVILWFYTDQTAAKFAWEITSPATCRLIGAGYLGGALFFGAIALGYAKEWSEVRIGVLAVLAFVLSMAGITILHWDRFPHSQFPTLLWDVLYFGLPAVLGYAIYSHRSAPDESTRNISKVHTYAQLFFGISLLFAGVLMYFLPGTLGQFWPWPTTPVTARAIGGWMVLPGVVGVGLASKANYKAWRLVVYAQMLSIVMMLLGLALSGNEITLFSGAIYAAGLLLIFVVDLHIVYTHRERQRNRGFLQIR
jgi:hypothetical protein